VESPSFRRRWQALWDRIARKHELIAPVFSHFGSDPKLRGLMRRLAAILKSPVSLRTVRQDILTQERLPVILNRAIYRTTALIDHLTFRFSESFPAGFRFWR